MLLVGLFLALSPGRAQISSHIQADKAASIELVPAEKIPPHGTFWSLQRTNFPPWPFYPPFLQELSAPVYLLDGKRGVFVVDDRQADYPAMYQQREAEKALRKMEWSVGLLSDTEYWAQTGDGPSAGQFHLPFQFALSRNHRRHQRRGRNYRAWDRIGRKLCAARQDAFDERGLGGRTNH